MSPATPTPTGDGPPPPDETPRALRWVLGSVLGVLVVYLAVALLVTDDAWLTRVGTRREVDFIRRDIRRFDRAEDVGDAPVTWIVGSSIAREAFDAARIEARLQAAGSEHRVVKFAFNRGAPVFTGAILDELPIRPGDRVVTSLAEGNFRQGWLVDVGTFDHYAQALLDPGELLALQDVPLPTRLEWSLASTPPAAFYRNQRAFRRGITEHIAWLLGQRKRRPLPRAGVKYQPFSDTNRTLRPGSYDNWDLPADDVRAGPGQTNWDALGWLIDDCAAREIPLLAVYVPAHPRYYERFLADETLHHVHDALDARDDLDLVRLTPRQGRAYMDWKHPNNRGRPGFSDEVADLLLERAGRTPASRPQRTWVAPRDAVPARLWDGVAR